ncbi:MAG: hypothetical protein OXF02_04920 [Simkaniaceae bacterium]|nr:hypothetical protein [Simkaniaceae bacterium]
MTSAIDGEWRTVRPKSEKTETTAETTTATTIAWFDRVPIPSPANRDWRKMHVRAEEQTCEGHPYVMPVKREEQRTVTKDQQKTADYRLYEISGKSISGCARKRDLCPGTLMDATRGCDAKRVRSNRVEWPEGFCKEEDTVASAIDGERSTVRPKSEETETTITRLDRIPTPPPPLGYPPRLGLLPNGERRPLTEEIWDAIVDYAVKQRKAMNIEECAEKCGVEPSDLSVRIIEKCRTHPKINTVALDAHSDLIHDHRSLLADLREKIGFIFLSNYIPHGQQPSAKWKGRERQIPAIERNRGGHPRFEPAGRGEKRHFSVDQQNRVVDFWFDKSEEELISVYARRCNLPPDIVSFWLDSAYYRNPGRIRMRSVGLPRGSRKQVGTSVIWLDQSKGGPPLRVISLPKGRKKAVTKEVRKAVVNYAVEQRGTMSPRKCAEKCGVAPSVLSHWVIEECRTCPYIDTLESDTYNLRTTDYITLLADLQGEKRPTHLPDYIPPGQRPSAERDRIHVRADEHTREGYPYFSSPGRGKRRIFSQDQKERVVDYWFHKFEGDSVSECARRCNLLPKTLFDWINEAYAHILKRARLAEAESPDGGDVLINREIASGPVEGHCEVERCSSDDESLPEISLDDATGLSPAGVPTPSTQIHPLPKSKEMPLTEEIWDAIIDYAVEQRGTKLLKGCAKKYYVDPSDLSNRIMEKCKTHPDIDAVALDAYNDLIFDHRMLLADLREGKRPILFSDYIPVRPGLPSSKPPGRRPSAKRGRIRVRAEEEIRGGRPYFMSVKSGEQRIFSQDQKRRMVAYRFCEREEDSVSECARRCNLLPKTLSDWISDPKL